MERDPFLCLVPPRGGTTHKKGSRSVQLGGDKTRTHAALHPSRALTMATIHLMTSTSESEDAQDESQLPILSKQAPITMPKLILERSTVRSVIGTEDIDPPSQPTLKKRARHALSTACRQHPARERSLPAHLAEYHVVSNQTKIRTAQALQTPRITRGSTAPICTARALLTTRTARAQRRHLSVRRKIY